MPTLNALREGSDAGGGDIKPGRGRQRCPMASCHPTHVVDCANLRPRKLEERPTSTTGTNQHPMPIAA